MTPETIAKGLNKATRKSGGGWSACCPAHDDNNPSLSIDEKDGKVLIHCFAGCSQEEVINELKARGLWENPSPVDINHPQKGKPDQSWAYHDRNGEVIGFACRFNKKGGGKYVLPCFKKSDSWLWKAPAYPRPLYNSHLISSDKTILVVEGEKTADAASSLLPDYIVTTWQGGACAAEKADWSLLKNCNVTIWPDADNPGKSAANVVATKLEGLAKTVRIVEPPDVEGWDLADALTEGWTNDEVRRLIDSALPPQEKLSSNLVAIRGNDIKPIAQKWLWDGYLALGKLHILAGAPGTGKTTIATSLAATLSKRGSWPDNTTAEVAEVAIWSGEDDPHDTLAPRLIAAGANMNMIHFISAIRSGEVMRPFDPATDMPELKLYIKKHPEIKLLIIDPVVSAISGDSHKNAEVRRNLQPLVDLGHECQCAIIGISHFSKGTSGKDPVERVTGSIAFGALARIVLATAKVEDDSLPEGTRLFARAKSNIGIDNGGWHYQIVTSALKENPEITTTTILWGSHVQGSARELLAAADATDESSGSALEEAKQFLKSELSSGALQYQQILSLAQQAGMSERTLKRAKSELKILSKKDGDDGRWRWYLPENNFKDASTFEECHAKTMAPFKEFGILQEKQSENTGGVVTVPDDDFLFDLFGQEEN